MIHAELGPELEAYVQQLIDSGRYSSRQEVLKEGVLLLQQQEHLTAFKAMLDKGIEDSENGLGRPADEFFDELVAKTRKRANASSRTEVLGNDEKPRKLAAAELSAFDASIERGLAEIKAGGGIPAEPAFKRLFEKYPHLR